MTPGVAAKGKQLLRKGRGKKSSTESFVILEPESPPPRRKSGGLIQAAFAAAGKIFSSDDEDPDFRPSEGEDENDSVYSGISRQTNSRSGRSQGGPPAGLGDDPTPATETTYYIRKFQLDLNGSPIDQVSN